MSDFSKVTINGTSYNVKDATARASAETNAANIATTIADISDAFSEGTDYTEGDYCIYENTLYQFTADHAAGEWTGEDVEAITVAAKLSELNENLDTVGYNIISTVVTISGNYPSTSGEYTTFDYPDGFNSSNILILGLSGRNKTVSERYYSLSDPLTTVFCQSDAIYITTTRTECLGMGVLLLIAHT